MRVWQSSPVLAPTRAGLCADTGVNRWRLSRWPAAHPGLGVSASGCFRSFSGAALSHCPLVFAIFRIVEQLSHTCPSRYLAPPRRYGCARLSSYGRTTHTYVTCTQSVGSGRDKFAHTGASAAACAGWEAAGNPARPVRKLRLRRLNNL